MNIYKKKVKIAVIAPPFSGHLYPLLDLVRPLLKYNQYDIYVYSGKEKKNVAENLGFKFKALLEKENENIYKNIANTNRKTNIKLMYRQFMENIGLINKIIPELKDEFIKGEIDLVIADFIAIPAGIVANDLSIPWITTIPTPFAIENKEGTPSYFGGLKPRFDLYGKARDFFARKLIRIFKIIFYRIASKKLEYKKLKMYNERGEENIYSPFSILALGMKEIEFRNDFPKHLIWMGPCLLTADSKEKELKDEIFQYDKKVLLTTGTHLLWSKDKIIALAKYLSKFYKDIAFIVSLGDDKKNNFDAIYEENVFVYNYLEYNHILPKVNYVIHHGGAGILYSCIKFAKPALIMPHDYDQFDYAVRAELSDIAITTKTKKENKIKEAFDKLINRKEWKSLNEISSAVNKYKTEDILKSEIERILKRN